MAVGEAVKFKTIVILILVVLCLIVIIQNTEIVTLRWLFWEISMSRIIFIPFLLLAGFVLGLLVSTFFIKGKR